MKKKYTRSLLLAASLFLLPASFQSALAADLNSKVSSSLDKRSAVTQNAKATVASEKQKVTSTDAAVGKLPKVDLNHKVSSNLDKSSAVTQNAKATVASEKKKVTSTTATVGKLPKIDLNSANVEQLTAIKGIGDKTAQAIVDYRKKNGDFTNLKDLINVKGIGAKTLKKVMPYLSL